MNSSTEPPPVIIVAYVSGPVNARKIHADSLQSREPEYFGTSYLAQFLRLVRVRGGRSVVVTTLPDLAYDEKIEGDRLVNISPPRGFGGVRYHLAMLVWSLRTLRLLWVERPHAVVLTACQNYFFMFAPLRLRGTAIIVSLHCMLWPKFGRVPQSWAWFRWLNARLIFRHAAAIQCVSSDIRDQVVATIPATAARVTVFRPTYDPSQFDGISPPDLGARDPFRILFVGRVEANKGPFDLLTAAAKLSTTANMPRFRIDFCGEGMDLERLRAAVVDFGLADRCFVQGVCDADRVRAFYGESHIVVVPTRSDFEEGYNKVCAEAVLAGRPVVTSAACPALADISAAAVEVCVDGIDGYAEAILRLATDETLYLEKATAARIVSAQYFDKSASYEACLEATLVSLAIPGQSCDTQNLCSASDHPASGAARPINKPGQMSHQPTIAYVSGPVDARKIRADASAAREPEYFGTSYLTQLLRIAWAHDARAVVITTLPDTRYDDRVEGDRLANIAPPLGLSGVRYHLAMLLWSLKTLRLLWRERPDVVVLTASANYFFMLSLLRLRGTAIILALHCTLWPKFGSVPRSWFWLRKLNGWLTFRCAEAILCASRDIRDQVLATAEVDSDRIDLFLPTYEPQQFAGIPAPGSISRVPFRVLFVGRIEENKGPFDLIAAATKLLANPAMPEFRIDFCGDGLALVKLSNAVAKASLADMCFVHGVCSADRVRAFYGESHIVVVPTRSDFEEGYNMVCAEAVLAGRPVVTSAVCPALADISAAAVEVCVDDIDGYADAILRLATDETLYLKKAAAARIVRDQYLDKSASYGTRLEARLLGLGVFG